MRRDFCLMFCVTALCVLGASASAEARDWRDEVVDPVRIYGGLWLGFAGDADGPPDAHLDTTLGGQFGVDAVVSRHFSLGGEARIGASKLERTGDRSKLIDLDFKPRLRLPLRHAPIELYLAMPVGLTIPRLADIDDQNASGKAGWNIGVAPGVNFWITDSFGLNAEPAWLWHRFDVDGPGDNDHYTLKQFSLFLNAVIAL